MAAPSFPLALDAGEAPLLRSAMYDIQIATSWYYACTAETGSIDTLATCVRATTSFIQVLNELLEKQSTVHDQYQALLRPPVDPRVEVLLAFKYARNVMQHVLHPVEPQQQALIGGLHGIRGYFLWADVPACVDAKLNPGTRALRSHFENRLRGREVTDTFLGALRAFATVAPELVHLDALGEWTGFPLPEQPGVAAKLHPMA